MIHELKAPVRSIIEATLGSGAVGALATAYDETVARSHYSLEPRGRRSERQLRELKDVYRGKRCFIVGNGPSLNAMDLSPLEDEFTFGLNRIYLMFEKLGFQTTFLVVGNSYVMQQCAHDIANLSMVKFLTWQHRKFMSEDGSIYFRLTHRPSFSLDASRSLWGGATVTFIALELAYHLGFEEVILIGVDHSFVTTGKPGALVQFQSDSDPNHFSGSYFGKGFRWQLPDLEVSDYAYTLARRAFEIDGRFIYNATVDGKLEVFSRRPFQSFFPSTKVA